MSHNADDAPCDAPKPFVDFGGRLYGAHEIARNLGSTCPYCKVTFEFWGDVTPSEEPAS